MMLASSASANVFDPAGSTLQIRIGGLRVAPVMGEATAPAKGVLTGGVGAEVVRTIQKGMGQPAAFSTTGADSGANNFTGTPNISNIFLTIQNGNATFTQGFMSATFQGNTMCPTPCFGGTGGLVGQALVEVLGAFNAPISLGVIGAGGQATASLGTAQIVIDGAGWVTNAVPITGIATNVIQITAGARVGAVGVGFTLQQTLNEDSIVLTENGVVQVTVAGTTDFTGASPTSATAGFNQVGLVSPVYIDASDATGNPPLPGAGIQVLRFVPEPGTMLLLGSAVAGLLVVGRKRMKR